MNIEKAVCKKHNRYFCIYFSDLGNLSSFFAIRPARISSIIAVVNGIKFSSAYCSIKSCRPFGKIIDLLIFSSIVYTPKLNEYQFNIYIIFLLEIIVNKEGDLFEV